MAERKVRRSRQVSKKEVRELSALPWVRDEALSSDSSEARVLPDGRVLSVYLLEGKGRLFPSREALANLQREAQEERAKWEAGLGMGPDTLLPPLDDFLRDAEAHAKSLGKVIGVPEEALDRT